MQLNSITLGKLLEERAAADGQSTFAFFEEEGECSASELNQKSDWIAHKFSGLGVAEGSRVMLIFSRTGKALLGCFGACWKLGAIAYPTEYGISPEALAQQLESFKPHVVVLDERLGDEADIRSACRKYATLDLSEVHAEPSGQYILPVFSRNPDGGAVCIYTSGSTGNPKGVLLSHQNLIDGAENVISAMGIGAEDRVLCVLPLSHLNGLVTTFIAPLISGGTVVYVQSAFDPRKVLPLVEDWWCTWFSAIPMHFALMMNPPVENGAHALKSLRFCRSASAPLSVRLLSDFENHYGVPIIETMGMTETSGQIFANPLPPATRKDGSVGFPVGFEVKIVSDDGAICGPGDKGNLMIRGAGIMQRYLDDPAETKAAFEEEWLKTGDIAEQDEDGFYFIRGRKKAIAIFSGTNISLNELEAKIAASGISYEAACIAEPHGVFGEVIIAYVAVGEQESFKKVEKEIIGMLEPVLPSRQALKEVRFIRKFPRSGAGKILKSELVRQLVLHTTNKAFSRDPAILLENILGIPKASINDQLAMGKIQQWDSLAHISLVLAVEEVLGRRLAGREIISLTTFVGLSDVLSDKVPIHKARASRLPARELVSKLKDHGYGSYPVNYVIISFNACMAIGIQDAEEVVEELLAELPEESTLIMNCFTWKFFNGGAFHFLNSPCEVGLINELFRRYPGVRRGNHPAYSFAAIGPRAQELVSHDASSCWGVGSTSHKLLMSPEVRVITMGVPFPSRNNALHVLEELEMVPYRTLKKFSGIADFGHGPETYETMFLARKDMEMSYNWKKIGDYLRSSNRVLAFDREQIYSYMNSDILEPGIRFLKEDPFVFVDRQ